MNPLHLSRLLLTVTASMLISASHAEPAQAALVEFTFGGEVDFVNLGSPPFGLPAPWNTVAVGDAWSTSYVFDSTTADTHAPPTLGDYPAISHYDLTIGSATEVQAVSAASTFIRVFDNQPAGADQYEVFIPILQGLNWFMQLDQLNTNTPFTSDALPLCGDIRLIDFTSVKDFTLSDFITNTEIHGSVDFHSCRVVPEPVGLVLGLVSLAGLITTRNRA